MSQRIDKLLVEMRLVKSRALAQRLIQSGSVDVLQAGLWQVVDKVSNKYPTDIPCRIRANDEQRFVSRAGLKLDAVLSKLPINLQHIRALDIGQSTGGFTDCLLQHGCAHVVGVDVGHSQLDDTLQQDQRVASLEQTNARTLLPQTFASVGGAEFDIVVMDVSFISQTHILPCLTLLMKPGAHLISLVKPQFEVGPEGLAKGGIVKDHHLYSTVQEKIHKCVTEHGLLVTHYTESPILGGDGNKEFFIVAYRP